MAGLWLLLMMSSAVFAPNFGVDRCRDPWTGDNKTWVKKNEGDEVRVQ